LSGSGSGWGAVDADGPASLLPGLELFVHSLLFGDDGYQGVGHLLELLLVRVVELVHPLGERPVCDVIAASVPGGCLMYHGDDFPQQRKLLVLGSGAGGRGSVGFLIFFDGAWEFTSGVLTRRSLFSRYPSHPAWSLRSSSHTPCVDSLFSRYPSHPAWSLRGSSHTPCVCSLFSRYPSRAARSLRGSSHTPCVGSLFSGSGGRSTGHGDREVGLWREIIDCVFSFLSASPRTRVSVSLWYSMLR